MRHRGEMEQRSVGACLRILEQLIEIAARRFEEVAEQSRGLLRVEAGEILGELDGGAARQRRGEVREGRDGLRLEIAVEEAILLAAHHELRDAIARVAELGELRRQMLAAEARRLEIALEQEAYDLAVEPKAPRDLARRIAD